MLKGETVYGHEFVGFRDGWRGLVEGDIIDLPRTKVRGLARQGGTILGTSRTNPYDHPQGGPENISIMLERHGIDAVVAIGGLVKLPLLPFRFARGLLRRPSAAA